MISLWNESESATFDGGLALRVYASRLLGEDPSLVLHGGGNTSVKVREKNLFGEESSLTKPGVWAGFTAGFSAVLANPKASLFYMTLLPNFFDFNKINYVDIFLICCLSALVPMVGNLMLAGALGKMRSYFSSSSVIVKMNIFSGVALIIVGLCISLL